MTRDETKTLLMMISRVFMHLDVSRELIDVWHAVLERLPFAKCKSAVIEFLSSDAQFPPTPGKIFQMCQTKDLPKSLVMSPAEAIDSKCLLALEARNFADRQVPDNSRTQYDSIEDLHKAENIKKAVWRREFIQRFELMQGRALEKVTLGQEPKKAILETLECHSHTLPTNQQLKALVQSVTRALPQ